MLLLLLPLPLIDAVIYCLLQAEFHFLFSLLLFHPPGAGVCVRVSACTCVGVHAPRAEEMCRLVYKGSGVKTNKKKKKKMDQEILVSFYTEFLPLRGRKSHKPTAPILPPLP